MINKFCLLQEKKVIIDWVPNWKRSTIMFESGIFTESFNQKVKHWLSFEVKGQIIPFLGEKGQTFIEFWAKKGQLWFGWFSYHKVKGLSHELKRSNIDWDASLKGQKFVKLLILKVELTEFWIIKVKYWLSFGFKRSNIASWGGKVKHIYWGVNEKGQFSNLTQLR